MLFDVNIQIDLAPSLPRDTIAREWRQLTFPLLTSHPFINFYSGFSPFVSFRKGFVEIGFNLILKRLVFVGGDFPVTIPVNEWE